MTIWQKASKVNYARCFKITEKVSFNIKSAKKGQFWQVFETVLPDRSLLVGHKFECDILSDFQTLWYDVTLRKKPHR